MNTASAQNRKTYAARSPSSSRRVAGDAALGLVTGGPIQRGDDEHDERGEAERESEGGDSGARAPAQRRPGDHRGGDRDGDRREQPDDEQWRDEKRGDDHGGDIADLL